MGRTEPADVALLARPLPAITEQLANRYRLHPISEDPASLGIAVGARALITTGGKGASAALIEAMPRLEIVAVHGVGLNRLDLDAARDRGIRVTNTPDVLTDDVADLAIGLIIAVYRQMGAGERYVRDGNWGESRPLPLARSASQRRLGIVGLGRIGKAIARRAEPMMASIAYWGRHAQDVAYTYFSDVARLAENVDVLVLAIPGGPATDKLIDREVLDALGPEGVLINVARGSVVDEEALVEALVEGRLGGAGLDVFTAEPMVPAALCHLDNVVLQPHRGSATDETRMRMGQLVVDNLAAHFDGRTLLTPVV